jgi:hypothetical protein
LAIFGFENLPFFGLLAEIEYIFSEKSLVCPSKKPNTDTCSAHNGVGLRQGVISMNAELDTNEPMQWIDDLGGLGLDELRDLPYAVQAGMDIAVFE